jgi:predicted MPP superfamily phosphohydrolase
MFGAGLIVAYSILLAYVSWRVASVPLLERWLSRRRLIGAAAILWVVFYVGRTWAHSSSGPLATALELAGMTCLGAMLLCSVALLAVDLVTGFGFLLRSQARTLRGWALLAGGILSIFALVQGLRPPAVVSYEVVLPSLPAALDGTVLVAMSDAHLGALAGERWLAARAAQAQALQPDLIVLLGDMFEGHGDGPASLPALRDLPAPLGKWFVTGNHEFHHDSGPSMDALQGAGFRRIDDAWAEAAPGLIVAGASGLAARHGRDPEGDAIGRSLAGRPAGATVFLSHAPRHAEAVQRAGAELMLSAHTHGGQIWPFGYLVRTAYPLLGGRYSVKGMPVIVCRGTRTWGPPMRLWRRGEILRIALRARPRATASVSTDAVAAQQTTGGSRDERLTPCVF